MRCCAYDINDIYELRTKNRSESDIRSYEEVAKKSQKTMQLTAKITFTSICRIILVCIVPPASGVT